MDKRGWLNEDEAHKIATYLCYVAGSDSEVVIEVLWSNPWLNRVLLPCFLQMSKLFVHDDSLSFLDTAVIHSCKLPCSDNSAVLPGPCVCVDPSTASPT